MSAITIRNVTKNYGNRRAVDNLNLEVGESEIFGFLGPNGAGKTTTLGLLLGFLRPDSGEIRLLGEPATQVAAHEKLGFLPDIARIDGGFRGQEWLEYLAALHPRRPDPAYREQLYDRLELARADRQRRIKTYSRGMRQKLAIIQALQHRPELILMDEPTEGLDPLAKRNLFDLLQEIRAAGATIFFSSHVLSEVERLCDRVALIRAGKLVAVDSIAALRDRQTRRIELTFADRRGPEAELQAIAARMGGEVKHEGQRWILALKGDLNPLLALLAHFPVSDIVIEPADLEDIFLSYYSAR